MRPDDRSIVILRFSPSGRRLLLWLVAVGWMSQGCGGDPAGGGSEDADLPVWSVEPERRISADHHPEAPLTYVLDLELGPSREILLTDLGTPAVVVLDSLGRFQRRIGRRGDGPGELAQPGRLGWRGDTLWVQDSEGRRVEMFSTGGEPRTSIRFAFQAGDVRRPPPTCPRIRSPTDPSWPPSSV